MAGYLDHYGVGEERREKIIRRVVSVAVLVLVVGGIAYAALKDYPEEHQARRFFDLLHAGNYKEAYKL